MRYFLRVVVFICLIAVIPAWFWYTFVRIVPIGDGGVATIATRFDGATPEPTPVEVEVSERLRELLPNTVTSLAYDRQSRTLRAYERTTGRAFSVSPLTLKVQALSEARLESFLETSWSPNGSEVISTFVEDGATIYRYYDYRSGRSVALNEQTVLFSFAPDGIHIVSIRSVGPATEFWISLPDGSGEWLLLSSRLKVISIAWPQTDTIAIISERPDGYQDLSLMNMDGVLDVILTKRNKLEMVWAPGGDTVLLSETSGDRIESFVYERNTRSESVFRIPTRASRCAWHTIGDSFTCGVADFSSPSRSSDSSVSRQDSIVTFNRRTGASTLLFTPDQDEFVGIRSPVMLPSDGGFAFINLFNQKPYLLSW